MANQILIKRGLEAARGGITPANGEPIWVTDTKQLYIGDGSTAGGISVGQGSMSNFLVSGDDGDATDTIADGETLNIDGGAGITTTVTAASNLISIAHDSHTGDVTGSTELTIAAAAVTYAKMQNAVSDNVLLGNNNGADSDFEELTAGAVRTILNVADGADVTSTNETSHTDVVVDGDFGSDGFLVRSGGAGSYSVDTNSYLNLTGGTLTGTAKLNDNVTLELGTGSDVKHFFNATTYITELESIDWIIRDSLDATLLSITHTTGQVDITNDLVIGGDLTVSGTTTTVNTETINLADNIITLNSNYSGSTPTEHGGVEIERGTLTNATLQWNETADYWEVDKADGTFYEISTSNTLASYLLIADIDDTPVDGITNAPISSNWAFDHEADADPHSVYPLLASAETITGVWGFTNATFDGGTY